MNTVAHDSAEKIPDAITIGFHAKLGEQRPEKTSLNSGRFGVCAGALAVHW